MSPPRHLLAGATSARREIEPPLGPAARRITHVGANTVESVSNPKTGTLVLQPIPARGRDATKIKTRRSRRTLFTPRTSHFDRDNLSSAQDVFRGFWTLFWIVLATAATRTVMRKFEERGGLYKWDFAELISEDGMNLAMSDAIMVGSTLLCVPFVKVRSKPPAAPTSRS